jgi:ribosome-associated toxin RatA of RatAB toxin-antitoxin module
MKKLWSLVVLSLALAVLLSPRSARAADEEAANLAAQGKALRYTKKTTSPASPIDTGAAAILVNAPIATVRKIVTAYGTYQKFLSPFDQSRVLAKRKGVSEVYLQVPILHGAVRIWTVAEMSPPAKDGAGEVITGRFKRGNVSDFRANWRLRAVDGDHTILKLELLVDPKMPFPASLVTTHLVKAADKAVTAVRDRAQAGSPASATSGTVSASDAAAGASSVATRTEGAAPTGEAAAAPGSEQSSPRSPEPRAGTTPILPPPNANDVARRHEDVAHR